VFAWLLAALLLALALAAPAAAPAQSPLITPLEARGTVLLGGRLALRVEVALTEEEKARGLSGRTGLAAGTGMLFVYPEPAFRSMWMLGMRFPLDFLWIRDGRIVDLFENIPPPREGESPVSVASPEPAQYVLELPAGSIRAYRLRRGDPAEIRLDYKSP
jgi:uncharacterized membrane protein (UPF0127 family)